MEQRAPLLESRLLEVQGKLQREGDVQHMIARRLTNLSSLLGDLVIESRNFHCEPVLFTARSPTHPARWHA